HRQARRVQCLSRAEAASELSFAIEAGRLPGPETEHFALELIQPHPELGAVPNDNILTESKPYY
ncbi:MAG: hypothetical protein ACYSUP_02510, partial [Planctomycetota bacterium]